MKATSRFLVLTMLGNYKSNIAKILKHTFYSSYMPIGKKKTNIEAGAGINGCIGSSILRQILWKKRCKYNRDEHLLER